MACVSFNTCYVKNMYSSAFIENQWKKRRWMRGSRTKVACCNFTVDCNAVWMRRAMLVGTIRSVIIHDSLTAKWMWVDQVRWSRRGLRTSWGWEYIWSTKLWCLGWWALDYVRLVNFMTETINIYDLTWWNVVQIFEKNNLTFL